MLPRQTVVIDAVNHRDVGAVGRRRDKDGLRARCEVSGSFGFRVEGARAFERDVNAQVLPWQARGILDRCHLEFAVANADGVALNLYLAGEAAVHGIISQKVRVGLDRPEVIDRDHLDILAAAFDDGPENVAADAAESVDGDVNGHFSAPFLGTTPDTVSVVATMTIFPTRSPAVDLVIWSA